MMMTRMTSIIIIITIILIIFFIILMMKKWMSKREWESEWVREREREMGEKWEIPLSFCHLNCLNHPKSLPPSQESQDTSCPLQDTLSFVYTSEVEERWTSKCKFKLNLNLFSTKSPIKGSTLLCCRISQLVGLKRVARGCSYCRNPSISFQWLRPNCS